MSLFPRRLFFFFFHSLCLPISRALSLPVLAPLCCLLASPETHGQTRGGKGRRRKRKELRRTVSTPTTRERRKEEEDGWPGLFLLCSYTPSVCGTRPRNGVFFFFFAVVSKLAPFFSSGRVYFLFFFVPPNLRSPLLYGKSFFLQLPHTVPPSLLTPPLSLSNPVVC